MSYAAYVNGLTAFQRAELARKVAKALEAKR